ncbi:MAG: LysR family transcriptional regulator [Proteobacteria bacterium]|jgi:DNA-binding transcriptional LysR family regulator|nr:LysR family transcriptional regulator [Pseudomonadota bacterium]
MRKIDVHSMRLFLATVRAGSIARAAQLEHIAPSALSRRLADLEHALGAPLLVRSPRGIVLTAAGELVAERAGRIEAELQTIVRDVQASTGQVSGPARLWANPSAIVGALPERLNRFVTEHPAAQLQLHESSSAEVLRACLDDLADVGVAVRPAEALPSGLEAHLFATDYLLVVLPAGHPLCGQRSLRLAQVLTHPLIGIQSGGALDRLLHAEAARLGMPLHFPISVHSTDAQCRMVEAGLGLAVMPSSTASAYAGSRRFVRRALDEPWAQRELCVFTLRKSPQPAVVAALVEALRGD